MPNILGIAEVKRRFSEVIIEVSRDGEQFIIQKNGKPMAALVNLRDFEILERHGSPRGKKVLLAAIAAWEDFDDIDGMIEHIYKERRKAKDRTIK